MFVAGWLRDRPAGDGLRHANAAGTLAVMRRGPMEGVSTPEEIAHFLQHALQHDEVFS